MRGAGKRFNSASHFILNDQELFDDDNALMPPHVGGQTLLTAGDERSVEVEGVLFAKINGDSVDPAGSTIVVRTKALYVHALQSENLLP